MKGAHVIAFTNKKREEERLERLRSLRDSSQWFIDFYLQTWRRIKQAQPPKYHMTTPSLSHTVFGIIAYDQERWLKKKHKEEENALRWLHLHTLFL